MKYFYIKHNETDYAICATSREELSTSGVEITVEQFDDIHANLSPDKRIYLDANNKLQLRDVFTKWDESTKNWIVDDEAISKNKENLFKAQAQQALNDTVHYEQKSYEATCTKEQNQANLDYRTDLHKILKNMYNGTELPINPNNKE